MIGSVMPMYQILQLPFGILIAGAMPGAVAIKFSVPFAVKFTKLHMKIHKKSYSYSWNTHDALDLRTWKFALRNTAYSFAIMYNIVSWTGIENDIFTNGAKLLLLAPIAFFSLFGAIITHVSIFLLTKSKLMYEDSGDGSKVNLGRDLLAKLDWAMSPIALISFGYGIWKNINEQFTLSLIFSIIFIFIILMYSSFFSFYFLKKVHLDKLMKNLKEKLNESIK